MRGPNGLTVKRKSVSAWAGQNYFSLSETQRCGIAIMAKASTPGRTKTRLAPPLNFEEAAEFNTAFLQDITENVLLAGHQVSLAGYVAFGPPGSEEFFRRTLPAAIGLIDASFPYFGDCLIFTIDEILRRGHDSAVVLNSDSPTLPTSLLVETAEILARPGDRAVLGPCSDGGYYLLGLKRTHHRLFEDIAWSTEKVAKQTLARAREINLDVHVLPVWYDVDDFEGLRTLHGELPRINSSKVRLVPYHAAKTAALMERLWRDADFVRRVGRLLQLEKLGA